MGDAEQLYQWRIDEETIRQSTSPPPASLPDHRRWLELQLADPSVTLYVARDDARGVDVGTVRLEGRGVDEAEISLTIAPEQRRRGYAHELIMRCLEARGPARVVARVKPGNEPSIRVFRASGFGGEHERDGFGWLVHEPARAAGGANA